MTDRSSVKTVLVIVMVTAFLTPFTINAINLGIPAMGEEFNTHSTLLNWVVTSFLLASAAFLLPFGRLADIKGRRGIFVAGMGLFAVTSLLCALASTIEWLIVFRVLQGIASAMIAATAMAMLTSAVPPQERGKAMGYASASTYIGLSLGPTLGGFIVGQWSWRVIFYLTAAVAVVIFLTSVIRLKENWASAEGEQFDFTGSVFCAVSLAALIYGLSTLTGHVWSKYVIILGIVALIGFVVYEQRIAQPVLNVKIFTKNLMFGFSNLAALINYSATFALSYLLSLYLQTVQGYDPETAGLIMISQPLLMALLSPFAGRLSDRIQPRIIASIGMGLTGVGLFGFIFLSATTPLALIIANLVLIGIGFALFSSPNTNAVMSSIEKRYYGVASSVLGTMRLVGQALSMAIVTMISNIYIHGMQISSPQYSGQFLKSMSINFTIFTVLSALGVLASLAGLKKKSGKTEPQN